MKIVDYSTVDRATRGTTKTVQDFGVFLGNHPKKLGIVASLYKDQTAAYLTEGLANIYYLGSKGANKFQNINSMLFEWNIETTQIRKIEFAEDLKGTDVGKNGAIFTCVFKDRYYDKGDTFTLRNRRQTIFVKSTPVRKSTGSYAYDCVLVDPTGLQSVDLTQATRGSYTRFRSNYHPELSERGYSKFQSSTEMHRNYLSLHRSGDSYSQAYAVLEDTYIATAAGQKDGSTAYYKMNPKEKDALDTFMYARNQNILFGKTNYDINGKCTIQDENGRDVPMGDGIVSQIERYCNKFDYAKDRLTTKVFDDVLAVMRTRCEKPRGNHFTFICNDRMDQQVGIALRDYLGSYAQDGTYFFSKGKGGTVNVGADFLTYNVQGNSITFAVDRSLTHEYPDKAYGIFLDTSADLNTGTPGISMFTLDGSEMLTGTLKGMGGVDGKTSGDIATTVAGSSFHIMGMSGVAVFNPYKSCIIQEAVY